MFCQLRSLPLILSYSILLTFPEPLPNPKIVPRFPDNLLFSQQSNQSLNLLLRVVPLVLKMLNKCPLLLYIIQSYVEDNKGRRRSLRHANLSNRFTCLPSDDFSIHSGASVASPTQHTASTIPTSNADTDSFQVYRDFSEMSPALPSPVIIDDHKSSIFLLSIDNADTNLTTSSITGLISSDSHTAIPAPPHAAAPTEHIPVNKLTSQTHPISHLPSSLSSSSIWKPRSISSIAKSPNPEKWTLALQNKINSLISQNVFDKLLR